jgi:hypothetical protein
MKYAVCAAAAGDTVRYVFFAYPILLVMVGFWDPRLWQHLLAKRFLVPTWEYFNVRKFGASGIVTWMVVIALVIITIMRGGYCI